MRTGGQQEAILVEQPPVHGVAGIDVLGNREVHEVDGSDDRDLPGPHIRFVDDAAHAAPVVAVGVGIDHRRDGKAFADVLLEQLPRRANHFRGHQRVKDDPAGLAPDEGDVGQVEAADLIDARDHLVEPVVVVQFGLTQQRGMDAVEFVLRIQKLKPLHVPGDMASVSHDLEIFHGSNKSLLLLLEISLVGERQRRLRLFQDLQREFRRGLALGMEMALQRVNLLSARRANIQDQMIGQGESGCRSRNGNHELPSGCHCRLPIESGFAPTRYVEKSWLAKVS